MVQEPWRADAACKEQGVEEWFPDVGESIAARRPKAICRECPVRLACLDSALTHREAWGIWGGFTNKGRARIRRLLQEGSSLERAVAIDDRLHSEHVELGVTA